MIKTNVINHLKACLVDDRMAGVILSIGELLERQNYNGDIITQYRVTDSSNSDTPVTSVSEVISAITEPNCEISSFEADNTMVQIIVNNLKVNWVKGSKDDKELINSVGSGTRLYFVMKYMNDNDTVLPLKISTFRLMRGE